VLCVVCFPCLRRLPCLQQLSARRVVPVVRIVEKGVLKLSRLDDSTSKSAGVLAVARRPRGERARRYLADVWKDIGGERQRLPIERPAHRGDAEPIESAAAFAAMLPTLLSALQGGRTDDANPASLGEDGRLRRFVRVRSARIIQRHFRKHQTHRFHEQMRRHHAAVLLQSVARERLGKKQHAARRIQIGVMPTLESWMGQRAEAKRLAEELHATLAYEQEKATAGAFAPSPLRRHDHFGNPYSTTPARGNDVVEETSLPWENEVDLFIDSLKRESGLEPPVPTALDDPDPSHHQGSSGPIVHLRDLRHTKASTTRQIV